MNAVVSEAQKLTQDAVMHLWQLDLTDWDEPIQYFSPHVLPDGSAISFGGQQYASVPVEASGFQWTTDGEDAAPTLKVPRTSITLASLVRSLDGLQGAKISRILTYRKHLDDGSDPDGLAHWDPEMFVIDQMSRPRGENFFKFTLSTPFQQAVLKLPGRLVTRDYCPWIYRHAVDGVFSYEGVQCPYVGTRYFDAAGQEVSDPAADVCGKNLGDCEKRHGKSPLPFGGYPGVGKARI